jgi:hypothetical protein
LREREGSGVDGWSERLHEREGLRDKGKRERKIRGEKVRERRLIQRRGVRGRGGDKRR